MFQGLVKLVLLINVGDVICDARTKSMYGDVGVDRRRNTLVGVCRPPHVDEDRKRDFEVQRRRASKSLGDYIEVNA